MIEPPERSGLTRGQLGSQSHGNMNMEHDGSHVTVGAVRLSTVPVFLHHFRAAAPSYGCALIADLNHASRRLLETICASIFHLGFIFLAR